MEQRLKDGSRYKFILIEDKEYGCPEEMRGKVLGLDRDLLNPDCVSICLLKEGVKRDEISLDPIEPIEMVWENRYSFRLPKKQPEEMINRDQIEYLQDIASLPPSLNQEIAEMILDYAIIKDPRSFHYKQWVGIRYSSDGQYKFLLVGFRYIMVKRPYSRRSLTWCGKIPPPQRDLNNGDATVPVNAMDEVLQHLRDDIGIKLTDEDIQSLEVKGIYFMPNVDHIWAY